MEQLIASPPYRSFPCHHLALASIDIPTPSLILRHPTRRYSMSPVRPAHHDSRLLSPTSLHLPLHIRSILDVLPEIADMAADLVVRLQAEGNQRDEAEGEPLPALHDAAAEVAAVLALHGDVLGAFEGGLEGCGVFSWVERLGEGKGGRTVRSAGEEEEHAGLCACAAGARGWVCGCVDWVVRSSAA